MTYLKPLVPDASVPDDVAGFFVQAQAAGPAVFVAVDPATLAGGLAVGDNVTFTVTTVGKSNGLRVASAVSGAVKNSGGNPVSGFAQNVSLIDFTDAGAIDAYESRLITLTCTTSANPVASGNGYSAIAVGSLGTPDSGTNLKMRLPAALSDSQDLTPGCSVTLNGTPMWRFFNQAQPSPFAVGDLGSVACPAPKLLAANATASTTVLASFDRNLNASTVAGAGFSISPTLAVSAAALSSARSVTLTTASQDAGATYTLTAAASVHDTRGTSVDGTANSAQFTGFDSNACAPGVVISQVYGGGGNSGATYDHDYIELHNRTAAPINVSGWSVQYTSSAGTGAWSVAVIPASTTMPGGSYLLLSLVSGGSVGAVLPSPNLALGLLNLSASNGTVALVNNGTALATGTCPTTAIDLVGFGTAACHEGGTAAPAGSNTLAIFRKVNHASAECLDTNVNGNDGEALAPSPHTSASATNTCTCP